MNRQSAGRLRPGPDGAQRRFPTAIDREIFSLAAPALGALAADPLLSVVDTVFVGRLGVVPLAALGINASIFALTFVVFNFLAYGTTPLVAKEIGRRDPEAAGRVVMQALATAVLLGLVATAVLQMFAPLIVGLMGAGTGVREPAISYLRIRALAGPAVLVVTAAHGAFRGYHDTRTPLVVTIGLNTANLVLDPLLIFGIGLGLQGAALATVLAQWGGAIWFVDLLVRRRRHALGITPYLPRLSELVPFLRVGGTLVARTLALIGTMTLATAIAARVGTVQVAAHQVATQVWLLLAMIVDALAVAAQAIVARYRGMMDLRAARTASDRLLAWGLAVGVALGAAFLGLAAALPRAFTDEPAIIAAVEGIYVFVVAMQPLNAVVFVWDGVFLGAEDFRFLALQMSLSATCAGVVLLAVLPLGWGLAGVWWGIVTLMVVRAATLAGRYWLAWPATHL